MSGRAPVRRQLVNLVADSILWIGLVCAASGTGLLLAAVFHH